MSSSNFLNLWKDNFVLVWTLDDKHENSYVCFVYVYDNLGPSKPPARIIVIIVKNMHYFRGQRSWSTFQITSSGWNFHRTIEILNSRFSLTFKTRIQYHRLLHKIHWSVWGDYKLITNHIAQILYWNRNIFPHRYFVTSNWNKILNQ